MAPPPPGPPVTPARPSRKPITPFTVIAIAAACVTGLGMHITAGANDPRFDIGTRSSFALPFTLIIFCVLYLVALRKRGAVLSLSAFGLLWLCSIAGGFSGVIRAGPTGNLDALKPGRDAIGVMEAVAADPAGLNGPLALPDDTYQSSGGPAREVERFEKTTLRRAVQFRNDYAAELDRIGWTRVLEPARLATDVGLLDSRRMLVEARQAIDRFEGRQARMLAEGRALIEELDIGEALRTDLRTGYDRTLAEGRADRDRSWSLERQSADAIEAMIDVLAADDGWTVEDDMVLFDQNATMNAYNEHFDRLMRIVGEQEAMLQRQLEEIREDLEG